MHFLIWILFSSLVKCFRGRRISLWHPIINWEWSRAMVSSVQPGWHRSCWLMGQAWVTIAEPMTCLADTTDLTSSKSSVHSIYDCLQHPHLLLLFCTRNILPLCYTTVQLYYVSVRLPAYEKSPQNCKSHWTSVLLFPMAQGSHPAIDPLIIDGKRKRKETEWEWLAVEQAADDASSTSSLSSSIRQASKKAKRWRDSVRAS